MARFRLSHISKIPESGNSKPVAVLILAMMSFCFMPMRTLHERFIHSYPMACINRFVCICGKRFAVNQHTIASQK